MIHWFTKIQRFHKHSVISQRFSYFTMIQWFTKGLVVLHLFDVAWQQYEKQEFRLHRESERSEIRKGREIEWWVKHCKGAGRDKATNTWRVVCEMPYHSRMAQWLMHVCSIASRQIQSLQFMACLGSVSNQLLVCVLSSVLYKALYTDTWVC